jgi:hypothetical protein
MPAVPSIAHPAIAAVRRGDIRRFAPVLVADCDMAFDIFGLPAIHLPEKASAWIRRWLR